MTDFNAFGTFKNLRANDVVEFVYRGRMVRARVLRLLTFASHVVVNFTACGHVVDESNFVRIVRRAQGI